MTIEATDRRRTGCGGPTTGEAAEWPHHGFGDPQAGSAAPRTLWPAGQGPVVSGGDEARPGPDRARRASTRRALVAGAVAAVVVAAIGVGAVVTRSGGAPRTMAEYWQVQDPLDDAVARAFSAVAYNVEATDPIDLQPVCQILVTRTKAALGGPPAPDAEFRRSHRAVLDTVLEIGKACSAGTAAGVREAMALNDRLGPEIAALQARMGALGRGSSAGVSPGALG